MDARHVWLTALVLAGCGPLVERYEGHDYHFLTTYRTWEAAQRDCASRDAHLVDVGDADENAWITAVASVYESAQWWIGLNDREEERVWVWESGFSGEFENWGEYEMPGDEPSIWDCASLGAYEWWDTGGSSGGGNWSVSNCGEQNPYICERAAR